MSYVLRTVRLEDIDEGAHLMLASECIKNHKGIVTRGIQQLPGANNEEKPNSA